MIDPSRFVGVFLYILALGISQKIPAMHIVNIAVLIIVFTIARDLAGVLPKNRLQVLMQRINARVDHGHNYRCAFFVVAAKPLISLIQCDPLKAAASRGQMPSLEGIGGTSRLSGGREQRNQPQQGQQ